MSSRRYWPAWCSPSCGLPSSTAWRGSDANRYAPHCALRGRATMSESRVLIRPLDGNRTGLALLLGMMAAAAALTGGWKMALVLALPVPALALGWWLLIEPTRWVSLFFAAALLLPPLPIPI